MSKYPVLPNEQARLDKLRSYDILGMSPESQFDDLTKLAAQILEVPMCQITLMDENWQEFISNVGTDLKGNHRELSFCRYAIVQNSILEVSDATLDERFRDNPFVAGGPKLRFYIGAPLIDDEGLVIGTICGYDLKPRKVNDAQKAMLEHLASTAMRLIRLRKVNLDQQKYVDIFKLNLDLLCILSEKGEWVMVNPAFTSALGYSESELLGKKAIEIVAPKHRESAISTFGDAINQTQESSIVCNLIDKNGKEVQYDWSYRSDAKTRVIVASGHDMTELLTSQQNLSDAFAVAEETLVSKERFISDMSHEIRTPLTAISGYMNLMKSTGLNAEQTRYVTVVESASNHLNHVVSDVLEDYRLSSNKLELDESRINFHEVVEKVHQFYVPIALEKKIEYTISLDPNLPKYVLGDETRLIQIFTNLLSNALKFTKIGGVSVSVKLLELTPNEVHIECAVSDTGIGVSAERKATIFERFAQGAKSIARNFGGTGLGLSISQRLIELHHGNIAVESELGKGTTFTFDLRLNRVDDSELNQDQSVEKQAIELNGARILVVDDNPHLQVIAGAFISRHNGKVEFASSGREAIERLKNDPFDLVLMDIQMEGLNGIETARMLREELAISLPIIGCSAYQGASDVLSEAHGTIDVMLKKPYTETELIALIHAQLSGSEWEAKQVTDFPKRVHNHDPIERSVLRLREREGDALVDKLLEIMSARLPIDIAELHEFIERENLEKIHEKAHFLNSSFYAFNFSAGIQLCNDIQRITEPTPILEAAKELLNFLIAVKAKLETT